MRDAGFRRVVRSLREQHEKEIGDALAADSAYIAALKVGYNLGVDENHEKLNEIIEIRLRQMSEARKKK